MGVEILQDSDSREKADLLFSDDSHKCLEAVQHLKSLVIGSNKQKGAIIERNYVPRLLSLLNDEKSPENLRVQTALTLCSLAKGTEDHIKKLIDAGTLRFLLIIVIQNTSPSSTRLTEACLRCLRSIFRSPHCPTNQIYEIHPAIPQLLKLLENPGIGIVEQECVANIFASACQTTEQQNLLAQYNAIGHIVKLLFSDIYKIQLPALAWFSQMAYMNENISKSLATSENGDGKRAVDLIVRLMRQTSTAEMQLASAKAITYLCRAGAISTADEIIRYNTLPTLVRLCKKDKESQIRAASAETIAYLTEMDVCLQQLASICDQLIPSLTDILKYQSSCITMIPAGGGGGGTLSMITPATVLKFEQEIKIAQDMKQAAFKAFASLASNDEEIRKRIIETDGLMENVLSGLSDPNTKITLAALRCLLSLSRSVQQLRTSFQDHAVWNPLKNLLYGENDEILTVASSTLCNLLLEFSPSKKFLLDENLVELLCDLTKREEPALRLNGVWALMNMSFQSDTKLKMDILAFLGIGHFISLLNDPEANVTMKSFGLMRNILSNKSDIDQIINLHGKLIVAAVGSALTKESASMDLKEQAICTLANIADGERGKELLMANEETLNQVLAFLTNSDAKLQIAATYCISNLAWSDEAGSQERRDKLKELGTQRILQQLNDSTDQILLEKVKMALQQFEP